MSKFELAILEKACKGSLKRNVYAYTSMAQEFAVAVGAETQIKTAIGLFKLNEIDYSDYDSLQGIENFINEVSPLIHKYIEGNNFLTDRLNKSQRHELGLDISKRSYNKKWRMLKRLEDKLVKFEKEQRKAEFQKIGKHGIVHQLDYENFSMDVNTACFIAYYNSRCNLRSVFTNKGQEGSFDQICDMLFKRCRSKDNHNNTNWLAISYIYPGQDVLARLSDEQKGNLLGRWTNIIKDVADLLEEVWDKNYINRQTMIVQRGNDSTTWNNTAGAWNKARDNWMNLIYALGMDYILDELCFGKVMRLMAADVVAWHRSSGGKLDPNTEVWNKLPLPWEVFRRKVACTKRMVMQCCEEAEIDAEKSGWIAPRIHGVTRFRPTPELVHGVAVANPFLAKVLKDHKYYSGKKKCSSF